MTRRRRALGLSSRDRGVLTIERKWGPGPDAMEHKLAEAQRDLGLSASGYALVLAGLVGDPVAEQEDPETIARLREIRNGRESGFGPFRY